MFWALLCAVFGAFVGFAAAREGRVRMPKPVAALIGGAGGFVGGWLIGYILLVLLALIGAALGAGLLLNAFGGRKRFKNPDQIDMSRSQDGRWK